MERTTLLVIIFSLHSHCFGDPHLPHLGLYETPVEPCVDERKISYDFTKILVTKTERMAPITDIITLPPDMSHIALSPVTETLTIFETQTQRPITIPVPHPGICQPSQPVYTSLTTLECTTTLIAEPIIDIEPIKEIELETVRPVTTTVTITTTMPKDTSTHIVMRHITNTEFEPTVTFMRTIAVTTTELLSPVLRTKRHGQTVEERPPPVTERHAPITMMQPPSVVISRIDVTQTRIPPAVSKMVMATTTTYVVYPCDDYSTKVPTNPFTHGRKTKDDIKFDLPIVS